MSTQTRIPSLDLSGPVEALWPELTGATERVLRSAHYILGPEVAAFEREAAGFLGTRHAVACNSGTDALVLALRALGIGPGDEVITTPFTFFATPEAISNVGAQPVFVDIDPETFNLDPRLIDAAVTPRTRALLPVHLFGLPCEMAGVLGAAARHGLRVVEDCAQSFGARYHGKAAGTMGHAGCFSFFPTKNLSGFGDGGLVATDDEELAQGARMLRVHGSRKKYHNEKVGCNSRLDELQAALLRVKLPRVEAWNGARVRAARMYQDLLAGEERLVLPGICDGHVFNQYTVRVRRGAPDRDRVKARLLEEGIETNVYYPVPCHRLPVYGRSHAGVVCPRAERAAAEVLSLPFWPNMDGEVQAHVASTLRRILGEG
ncbi:DegT/DnrJ/EryC1/StrS family aminotransferase [Mesoterricola silvestris]|uniref:Aminotransferase n=1 Tax=Mesoterricola silvestris TaxID=2927979 RepID=A0AA48GK41_9BACT|nr:DegT/DnrJ/EryC1/StrS family aminotransferase [Mesoterricola silvestris]BDU71219.1 aminotransferase [Mesoterricola silvestris]